MIEALWFKHHPVRWLVWPVLWPLSKVFSWVSQRRKNAYLSGKKTRYKASVPVVVVGNITAGGNGKTPIVIWLIEQLQACGYRPGVVSRGYGGKAQHYPLLVDDTTLTKHCGDEPKLIFSRTAVPVAVDPVRSQAVQLLEQHGVDIIITDDGLQHYALERDVEFVVVDGVRRFGNEQMMPLGPLREPISRLKGVDFIVTNGGQAQALEMPFQLEPALAVNLKTGRQREVTALGGLAAFAGIGHPPRFFNTLTQLGANLKVTKGFADHKAFEQQELYEFSQAAENVIMTEKDAVKCHSFAQDNWWYLPVTATFNDQDSHSIMEKIKKVINNYGSSSS
ncbi:tetraacyldisaccharide 4'-kinase [Vibrio sp. ZSDZ34]|uniref:Tetraacyldisaccharide 4'-kinase n=1 Tax=Vibrio gelatinilyticus TaxID=2893468 RepID=A0A9X1WBP4_9VIBR|nr:tetraacyldisaccharide 4'-kinase [Vibrio gelatinilyticus]